MKIHTMKPKTYPATAFSNTRFRLGLEAAKEDVVIIKLTCFRGFGRYSDSHCRSLYCRIDNPTRELPTKVGSCWTVADAGWMRIVSSCRDVRKVWNSQYNRDRLCRGCQDQWFLWSRTSSETQPTDKHVSWITLFKHSSDCSDTFAS